MVPSADREVDALTDREREILELIASGLSNEGIARALIISRRTVDAHVRSIFVKLGLAGDPLPNQRVRAAATYWRTGQQHAAAAA